MMRLPFLGNIGPLANGVRRGQLKRISSDFSFYGSVAVTVWLTSGEGFRLTSCTHNVAGRIEVGILKIELVLQPQPEEPSVDLPWSFRNAGTISKLSIVQSEFRAESGILLRSRDGDEVIIVAAAFPDHLYVGGLATPPQDVTPEYSLSRYLHEPI